MFRVTSLNGMSVIIKICIGVVTSKMIAIFVGPAGLALVANFRNFVTAAESISTLGFNNGVVKYVAQHSDDPSALKKIIATSFITLASSAVIMTVVLFFLAGYWSDFVFGNRFDYKVVFQVLAVALPWYAVSLFLISVINGLGKFRRVIRINIIGNIIGLITTVVLVWQFKTLGALLSIVIAPALLFFVTFTAINREIRFFEYISFRFFDFAIIRNLSSYSLMALVSAVCGPLIYLAIRNKLIVVSGIEAAGHWEAMMRISTYYLMFISTILSVYYLPKLSIATTDDQTRRVFWNYFKGVMPIFVGGLLVIYLLRGIVIRLLFSTEFEPVTDLFFWQLTGDIFKAASMVLGFQFFAARLTTAFIITELFSLAVLYISSIFLIAVVGVEGVVMAHALTYFIYLIVLIGFFRKKLF
ncbi:MAG: O-antigen translocase [Flavobacterium sp.]|nr:O-antigen translocase [Flavobacterium sp.]